MDSRERVLAAVNHEKFDRVPTDIWATPEVLKKLKDYFGSNANIYPMLHIDGIAGVEGIKYIGPVKPPKRIPRKGWEILPWEWMWGIKTRKVRFRTGVYYEPVAYPLADAKTVDDLEKYRWPRADWFDYSKMRRHAEAARRKQVVMSGYMAPFYLHNLLRGLHISLVDPFTNPEFTHHLLNRISDFLYEHHLHMFEACEGLIDLTQVSDDFGTQTSPMIKVETFREFYRPHLERFIDLAHRFGIKVFHHDDGGIRPLIPDLVEMGIDILNPLQWTCPGMELEGLKRDFGRHLCFHGGVDNQHILPFGTPEEVRAEVRHCIDVLSGDGTGYILAPCHNIQPNTPVENIIAMYDEAFKYGQF